MAKIALKERERKMKRYLLLIPLLIILGGCAAGVCEGGGFHTAQRLGLPIRIMNFITAYFFLHHSFNQSWFFRLQIRFGLALKDTSIILISLQ